MTSFLSAEELDITKNQREALIKTLVHLESGCLEHKPLRGDDGQDMWVISESSRPKDVRYFNMTIWRSEAIEEAHGCGTVCCIGGTAEVLSGFKVSFNPDSGTPLDDLFYPKFNYVKWDKITTEQGAQALRNYLTKGKPQWEKVVK